MNPKIHHLSLMLGILGGLPQPFPRRNDYLRLLRVPEVYPHCKLCPICFNELYLDTTVCSIRCLAVLKQRQSNPLVGRKKLSRKERKAKNAIRRK